MHILFIENLLNENLMVCPRKSNFSTADYIQYPILYTDFKQSNYCRTYIIN